VTEKEPTDPPLEEATQSLGNWGLLEPPPRETLLGLSSRWIQGSCASSCRTG
jgi:hypothetical protein